MRFNEGETSSFASNISFIVLWFLEWDSPLYLQGVNWQSNEPTNLNQTCPDECTRLLFIQNVYSLTHSELITFPKCGYLDFERMQQLINVILSHNMIFAQLKLNALNMISCPTQKQLTNINSPYITGPIIKIILLYFLTDFPSLTLILGTGLP